MYRVKAKVEFTGIAWGLHFINGTAETEDKRLADKLKKKGYEVSKIKPKADSKDSE